VVKTLSARVFREEGLMEEIPKFIAWGRVVKVRVQAKVGF
jgi:hypothetical protein